MARATAVLGPASEGAQWKAALDLYYADNVEGAFELIETNAAAFGGSGLRMYRMIEGEARTRATGEVVPLTGKLDFEFVADEVPHHEQAAHVVRDAVTRVSHVLQWDQREKVLATILVAEADADWHEARYGYCVDKVPYDKICLPQASTISPEELWRVVAHEYAHVVVLNTTQANAPHWLDEGVACIVEGRDPRLAAQRLTQAGVWRTPAAMKVAFGVDRRDSTKMGGVRAAYDQATVLVGYLLASNGMEGLSKLLRSFTGHPIWQDLVSLVAQREPIDHALQIALSLNESQLFKRALAWSRQ